jgi:hypothetical protein
MNIKKAAKIINIPLEDWPGNCSAIANAFIKNDLVSGKYQYGHYHGFISPESETFGGRKFTHHAWILRDDGMIVDPTKWVFENEAPYIFVGENDPCIYDLGGNFLYETFLLKPPPKYNAKEKQLTVPDSLQMILSQLLVFPNLFKKKNISFSQLFWLSNLPPKFMEGMEKEIYSWIVDDLKLTALIPIDNRRNILGK